MENVIFHGRNSYAEDFMWFRAEGEDAPQHPQQDVLIAVTMPKKSKQTTEKESCSP